MKHDDLLQLFAEYLEKQDILSQLTQAEELHGYSYSEIHTIDCIGTMQHPNVTKIAATLSMTRGAISKIAKRLLQAQLLTVYSLPENKKERYFQLTDDGLLLFQEHEKRHMLWKQRDAAFFDARPKEELVVAARFMGEFNAYLATQIQAITEEKADSASKIHAFQEGK